MPTSTTARVLLCAVFLFGLASLGAGMAAPAAPLAQSDQVTAGREIFGQACIQCHGPGHTAQQIKSEEGWRDTVYSMIARGAPVLPEEIEPLTSYLAATFGPNSGSAPGQVSQDSPSSTSQSTQALMEERCALCHPVEQVTAARKSEAEWKETIARMLIYGAQLTADEQQLLEVFLVENFAP